MDTLIAIIGYYWLAIIPNNSQSQFADGATDWEQASLVSICNGGRWHNDDHIIIHGEKSFSIGQMDCREFLKLHQWQITAN